MPPLEWTLAKVRHASAITAELVAARTGTHAVVGQLVPAMRLPLSELTEADKDSPRLVGVHVPLKAYPHALADTEAPILGVLRHIVSESPERAVHSELIAQIRLPARTRVVGTHTAVWLRLRPSKASCRGSPGYLEYAWMSTDSDTPAPGAKTPT